MGEEEGKSKNGVLLCAKRKYKKKHIQLAREKRKKDLLLHMPEEPHYGIGHHGRFNTDSFSHGVYKSQEKNVMSQVDPRDRLLLFDDKARQNPEFTAIYSVNQPKPVFQEVDEQEQ